MGSQPPAVCEARAVSSSEADLVLAGGKIRTPAHPSGFVQALELDPGAAFGISFTAGLELDFGY